MPDDDLLHVPLDFKERFPMASTAPASLPTSQDAPRPYCHDSPDADDCSYTRPSSGTTATPSSTAPDGAEPTTTAATDPTPPSAETSGPPISASTPQPDSAAPSASTTANRSEASRPSGLTDPGAGDDGPPMGLILAAVLVPVVVIALVGLVYMMLRRRKRRRDIATGSEEMKMRLNSDFQPNPEPSQQMAPRAVTPVPPPPPVIISAMNAAGTAAYYTGIDTSEALSVRTNSLRSNPRQAGFIMDGEFHEEPPPPYRPCSVPSLSRDSSMRSVPPNPTARPVNPFADPPEEDAVSAVSGPTMGPYSRRHDEQLSVVSDLSYQNDGEHEPVPVRQTV